MVIFYGAGAPNLQALLLYAILQPGGGAYGKGEEDDSRRVLRVS